MGLELQKPDEQPQEQDLPLTPAVIMELHSEMELILEKFVGRQCALYPGVPREVHRRLIRGSCLCAQAQFVLKQGPQ